MTERQRTEWRRDKGWMDGETRGRSDRETKDGVTERQRMDGQRDKRTE